MHGFFYKMGYLLALGPRTDMIEEVDRAVDNLTKSGKLFNNTPRRDSVPVAAGRPFSDYGKFSRSDKLDMVP
jgi:hypothetical protein